MFHPSESGSNLQPANSSGKPPISLPPQNQEVLRMFLLGDYGAIRGMIARLATNGIADANRWTPLQPTGRDGEYITVHTKRMAPEAR